MALNHGKWLDAMPQSLSVSLHFEPSTLLSRFEQASEPETLMLGVVDQSTE